VARMSLKPPSHRSEPEGRSLRPDACSSEEPSTARQGLGLLSLPTRRAWHPWPSSSSPLVRPCSAGGHGAGIAPGQRLTRKGELPRGLGAARADALRAAEEGASTGPGLARRGLAARLGGAQGSSPVKGVSAPQGRSRPTESCCPVEEGR